MLLAINIGNSNIVCGGYTDDGKLTFCARLYSDSALSSDELTYKIVGMLDLYGVSPLEITDAILSSVVPALTPRVREAIGKLSQAPIMTVGPGLKSGVRIRMDNPAQLGGELLCAAVSSLRTNKPPLIVMTVDTAVTMLAIDSAGSIVGGAILPAPQLALAALVRNTAQLPQVELESRPKGVLGSNTADSLQSGIVNGSAAMIEGMVARFRKALDAPEAPVIATGSLPDSIREACGVPIFYRETLILDGLYAIWRRNVRR